MTTHSSVTRRVNLEFFGLFCLWRDVDRVGFKSFFIKKIHPLKNVTVSVCVLGGLTLNIKISLARYLLKVGQDTPVKGNVR